MVTNQLAKLAINKSLLKEYSSSEYSRVVYMKDNSEFQIQIFNPYDYTIGADISINGKRMSNRIIIKPGQRIWLERYIDEARKFLFSTYEVENIGEALQAIHNNGLISISFYKEKLNQEPIHIYKSTPEPYIYDYQIYNNSVGDSYNLYGSSVNFTNTVSQTRSLDSNITAKTATCYTSCANVNNTLGLSEETLKKDIECKINNDTIETGRVEKGSYSNQKFENVFIDFEYCSFKLETIQILPISRKPYTNKDLKKVYCVNCGRKLNTKYKFCPYCGSKVTY